MPYSKEKLNKHIADMDKVGEAIGGTERRRAAVFDLDLEPGVFRYGPGLARLTHSLWSTLWKVVYVCERPETDREAVEETLKQANAVSPMVNLAGLYPPRLVMNANSNGKLAALREYGVDVDDIALVVCDSTTKWAGRAGNCDVLRIGGGGLDGF